MGPKRDNVWRETGLLESFPEGGPRVVWRTPVAGGYAGPAVAGGKLYVTDYVTEDNVKVENFDRNTFTGNERVLCLDAETGKEIWKHEYPVKYTISYPAGPRCTPVVDDGKVYTLGAEGNLICFDAATGDVVWQKDLPKQYNTKAALWGYSGHPLIDGNKLICAAGGDDTHTIAFNKSTGEEIWHAFIGARARLLAAHDHRGRRQAAAHRRAAQRRFLRRPGNRQRVLVAALRGHQRVDHHDAAAMEELPVHRRIFQQNPACSSWPPIVRRRKSCGATSRSTASRRSTCSRIIVDETMYGVDGNGQLYGVELPSGRRLWNSTAPISARPVGTGTAFIVRQGDTGDRFWLFNDSGDLIIAELSPAGYEEIDRTHLIAPTNIAFGRDVVWCMPAFANKRMYVRNDAECIAVDLGQQ